jgi:hypothetical protein
MQHRCNPPVSLVSQSTSPPVLWEDAERLSRSLAEIAGQGAPPCRRGSTRTGVLGGVGWHPPP